jgi:hypothetical protein
MMTRSGLFKKVNAPIFEKDSFHKSLNALKKFQMKLVERLLKYSICVENQSLSARRDSEELSKFCHDMLFRKTLKSSMAMSQLTQSQS